MKDIKTFLIGFLTCTCMFLIMGQTMSQEQIEQMKNMTNQMKNAGLMPELTGKYQGFSNKGVVYLVDTTTGELYHAKKKKKGQKGMIWKQKIKPKKFDGEAMYTK